ncbi:MAG TPA: DegV family protein [Acidimicrobiales bacterium]|nr:DegV family protein [Acidimicrobiales bacterium]
MLIVTDGAVDVPETLIGSALLDRVPGEVWTGEATFAGDPGEFWEQLRRGNYPSTTPPTVSALVAAYRHPDLVIALHVSRELSATMARAEEAAQRVGPGVVVVDTRSLSVGAGLIVTAVHRAARRSDASESVIDLARSLPDRLHTFAIVQEVESLRRSGRSGLLPSSHLVRHHPLVLAVRGRVVFLAQPKHRGAAVDEMARHLRRSAGTTLGAWALGHGDAADVDAVVDHLAAALGQSPRFSTPLDPTVGAHLGPDAIVVGAVTGPIDV